MTARICLAVALAIGATTQAPAADLAKIPRTLAKEPAYRTKTPKYCLLVFGPEAKTRVWLVLDGDTLYVDRNGNGDLTEPGEKVTGTQEGEGARRHFEFKCGDVRDGVVTHQHLTVSVRNPRHFTKEDQDQWPELKDLLLRNPEARLYSVQLYVARPEFRGQGEGGRLLHGTSGDGSGLLQFSAKPHDAPILHFGGPLAIRLHESQPLRLQRDNDVCVGVGAQGLGRGTFVWSVYEDLVPDDAHPQIEVVWPAKGAGDPLPFARYALDQRC